jgi:predicted MFS family arabinose efflux permease
MDRPGAASTATPSPAFTKYQTIVVVVLAFLQFTIILDFMILSPLGAMLMPALDIDTKRFGYVVSAYAFSAGTSGVLAAGFADRFDRKKLLMFFYCGFLVGTLLCALAPTYPALLGARIVTGLFGGVIGSIVFAITTDLFSYEMRGRVMGVVQTAFAGSQILGIPIGLYLANHLGWHAPFFLIVGIGAAAGVVIAVVLKPIDGHLALKVDRSPLRHLATTLSEPRYQHAIATTALLATGGFMLMPFGSAFAVGNLGITQDDLPAVYLATGITAMIAGPLLGRLSDKIGKFQVFMLGTAISLVMVLIYTRLETTPLPLVILVSAAMFVGISARMIASQALMSAVPAPESRGAFMSVSASVQQISGGLASVIAGQIVVQKVEGGRLDHFDVLGDVVTGAGLVTVAMMYTIHRRLAERSAVAQRPAA